MAQRIHRTMVRTPEEAARLKADRERYQREKPAPAQLLMEGGRAEFVTLGEYLILHQAMAFLKKERERLKLTLKDVSERSGIDEAALSRLENGQNCNPKFDTISRFASALGKKFLCHFQDVANDPCSPAGPGSETIPR